VYTLFAPYSPFYLFPHNFLPTPTAPQPPSPLPGQNLFHPPVLQEENRSFVEEKNKIDKTRNMKFC
jgi:hypothetical protein